MFKRWVGVKQCFGLTFLFGKYSCLTNTGRGWNNPKMTKELDWKQNEVFCRSKTRRDLEKQ